MEYLLCAPAQARRSANKTWNTKKGKQNLQALKLGPEYTQFLNHERRIAGKLGPALEITFKVFAMLAVGAVITSAVSCFLFDPLITTALFFGGLGIGIGAGIGLWRNEVRSKLAYKRSSAILGSDLPKRTNLQWAMTNLQITEAEAQERLNVTRAITITKRAENFLDRVCGFISKLF